MLKYILLWFPMLVIAIANGILREWYNQHTGEFTGLQISTVSLIIFFAVYIYWVVSKYPPKSKTIAIFVGILWMIMTLIFEFGFGLYLGNSWGSLLAEYNIFAGRLWILIPVWVTIAPYIFYIYRK